MEKDIFKQMQEIRSRYKRMKQFLIGFVNITLVGSFCLAFNTTNKLDLIRTKGIIMEDENGKNRILIGAPTPHSEDRGRTDTNLVTKYFASELNPENKDKYMEWYKCINILPLGWW